MRIPRSPLIATAVRLLLGGQPPAHVHMPGGQMYVLVPEASRVPVDLTGPNRFWEDENARGYRSEVALELLDPNVHGFMVLMLKPGKSRPGIVFRSQTEPHWREAFRAALGRVALGLVD